MASFFINKKGIKQFKLPKSFANLHKQPDVAFNRPNVFNNFIHASLQM